MKIGINKKIMGSFVVGVAMLGVSIGTAYFTMKDLIGAINEVKAISRKVDLTGDLRLYLNRILRPVNEYVIEGEEEERDHYDAIITQTSRVLTALKEHKGGGRWLELLNRVSDDASKLGEMAVDLLYTEHPMGNKEALNILRKMNTFSEEVIKETEEFHSITALEMEKMEMLAEEKGKRAVTIFAAVLAVNILAIPILYLYLSRYITRPILALHEGAKAIGRGKLDQRLTIKTGDEIEALAVAFNKMASSLEEAKKELDRRLLELYALYNISKVLNTTFETEQLLLRLVSDISKNLDIQRVMIMLLDERRQEVYSASFTDFEKEGLKELRRRVGEGFYGLVVQTGMARLIRDVDTELNLPKEDILSPDIKSVIAVPFGRREKVLGLLVAFKDKPGMFEWHDLELFRAVAENVAVALENARLYQETKLQAITDGLTGLYNHRFFREQLEVEIGRAERYGHDVALIIMDIDHFKHYNDTHGHPQGDELLRGLAELLRKSIRKADLACRYGGEEFAIILPETGKETAVYLAERIRKAISEHPFPFRETQPMGALTVSIGVAVFPLDARVIDKLIRKADDALYKAKSTGRNRVVTA